MITFYFIFALTVCNILLINLFVGVLFLKFNDASNEENPYRFVLLTQEQQRWLDFHKMIIKSRSDFASYSLPSNKIQVKINNTILKTILSFISITSSPNVYMVYIIKPFILCFFNQLYFYLSTNFGFMEDSVFYIS